MYQRLFLLRILQMPGASYLTKYLDLRDKNGVRVGDWATQAPGTKGYAVCQVCLPQKIVKFEKGSTELLKHSERKCHIDAAASRAKSTQKTLSSFITEKADDKILDQARDLEIILVTWSRSSHVTESRPSCLTVSQRCSRSIFPTHKL